MNHVEIHSCLFSSFFLFFFLLLFKGHTLILDVREAPNTRRKMVGSTFSAMLESIEGVTLSREIKLLDR